MTLRAKAGTRHLSGDCYGGSRYLISTMVLEIRGRTLASREYQWLGALNNQLYPSY